MNLTIELPDDLGAALQAKARAQGVSPSEVVREGLQLLELREQEDQAKLEWLRAAAKEGFDAVDRGDYVTLGSDQDIEEFMRKVGEDASAELAAGRNCGCTVLL